MFDVLFLPRARRSYDRLDQRRTRQVNEAIERVRLDPFGAPNVAPLHGELQGLHRIRIGDYRIVIEIRVPERRIIVIAIGSRGDICK